MNTPVAILVRVSTNKQETDRQVTELWSIAAAKKWEVVEVIHEHGISGASDDRPGLARAMELATQKRIRKVLVHEVSRVARKNSTAHQFIEFLEHHGVSLYWHAQSIETLLPDGKRNPAAAIMFALMAEMARSERETMVERIKSGQAEARRKGKRIGRPHQSGLSPEAFLQKHADVQKQLRAGQSIRHAAAITGKGASTVMRVARAMKAPATPSEFEV